MENNFYVGVIHHKKKLFKPAFSEKVVLYSDDNIVYLDLINSVWYTTSEDNKDFVDKNSLIITDISLYKEDYLYLLNRYKENSVTKIKKRNCVLGEIDGKSK